MHGRTTVGGGRASPALEKQRKKRHLTSAASFKEVGRRWFGKVRMAESTRSMRQTIFDRDILPAWKNRLLAQITAEDLRTLCHKVKDRGASATASRVMQRPRPLSDNGPSYVWSDLAEWLSDKRMDHTRGAPCHPRAQGKIESWHQTLKNRTLPENYFPPRDLERQIVGFVDHCNHRRYHESIGNLTPADVYFGRGDIIMLERERIKRETIGQLRLLHRKAAAEYENPDGPEPPLAHAEKCPKNPDDRHLSA